MSGSSRDFWSILSDTHSVEDPPGSDHVPSSEEATTSETTTLAAGSDLIVESTTGVGTPGGQLPPLAPGVYFSSAGHCPCVETTCRPPAGFLLEVVDPGELTTWTMMTPWSQGPQLLISCSELGRASNLFGILTPLCERLDASLQLQRHSQLGVRTISRVMGTLTHAMLSPNPSYQAWQTARDGWTYRQARDWPPSKMLELFLNVDTTPQTYPAEEFRYENIRTEHKVSQEQVSDAIEFWMTCLAADPRIPSIRFKQSRRSRWFKDT